MFALRSIPLALTILLAARHAWAQPSTATDEPVRLTWVAPTECPSRADVMARLERMLRHPAVLPAGTSLSFDAHVTALSDARFHLDLHTHTKDADGGRSFEAETCARVTSAMLLVVALAIDPERDPVEEPNETPGTTSPGTTAAPTVARAPDVPFPGTQWHFELALSGGVLVGMHPAPSVIVPTLIGVSKERFRLYTGVLLGGTQTANGGPRPDTGATIRFPGAWELLACGSPWLRTVRIDLCGGTTVGWTEGTGFNIASPATAGTAFVSAQGSVGLVWNVGWRVRVRLDLGAMLNLLRPRFQIVGTEAFTVHETSLFMFRTTLGIEASIL